jgi:hypothetical protein
VFILIFNSAHFAASTVRLYTKPGSFAEWPFLTMGFPVVTICVLTLALMFSDSVGRHFNALYLTWAPFHYAAQTFGLAVMYSHRSNHKLSDGERKLLRWICLLPFLYAFVSSGNAGLAWLIPASVFSEIPELGTAKVLLSGLLAVLTFAAPAFLVARPLFQKRDGLPLICLVLIVSNGVWWVVFNFIDAFLWATVFHGVQYLAIVTLFHVRDHPGTPGSRHPRLYETVRFYGMCLVLGYALFNVWPYAYVWAGFTLSESMLLVVVTINIHHFIVDRYIWRVSTGTNYKIVMSKART